MAKYRVKVHVELVECDDTVKGVGNKYAHQLNGKLSK